MWPLISSSRISFASPSARSGVSAKRTPPAFIRPPVRTCDLMTTGPATSSAMRLASSAVCAWPPGATGMRSRSKILRDSYSKNLMAARETSGSRFAEPGEPRARCSQPNWVSASFEGERETQMTAIIIIVAVLLIAALVVLYTRRRKRDREVIEQRMREAENHRQEATAHQQRAAEVGSEAARRREQADQLETEAERLQRESDQRRQEAEELQEKGDRALTHAQRHEGAAGEAEEEIDERSKRFRVR